MSKGIEVERVCNQNSKKVAHKVAIYNKEQQYFVCGKNQAAEMF